MELIMFDQAVATENRRQGTRCLVGLKKVLEVTALASRRGGQEGR
jgi:hypothetical protein